jgi:hypothetical protein
VAYGWETNDEMERSIFSEEITKSEKRKTAKKKIRRLNGQ